MTYSFGSSTASYATTSSSFYTSSSPRSHPSHYKSPHSQHSPSIFIPSRSSARSGTIPVTSRTLDLVDEDEQTASQLHNDEIDIGSDVFTMDMDIDININENSNLKTHRGDDDNALVTKLNSALSRRSPIPRIRPSKTKRTATGSTLLSQSTPTTFGRGGFNEDMSRLGKYHPAHFCGSYTDNTMRQRRGGDVGGIVSGLGNLAMSPTPTLDAVKDVDDDDIPTLDLRQKRMQVGRTMTLG